jgi:hypothetical protein
VHLDVEIANVYHCMGDEGGNNISWRMTYRQYRTKMICCEEENKGLDRWGVGGGGVPECEGAYAALRR